MAHQDTITTIIIKPGANLRRHHLSVIFGDMSEPEFAAFVADIKKHGVLNPVTLYEGAILDGHHRYRACEELGIDCPAVQFRGSREKAKAFVVSTNNHRRHEGLTVRVARRLLETGYDAPLATRKEETAHTLAIMHETGASQTVVNSVKRVIHRAPKLLSAIAKGGLKLKHALDSTHPAGGKPCVYPQCTGRASRAGGSQLCGKHKSRLARGSVDHTPLWPSQVQRLIRALVGSGDVILGVEGEELVALMDGERYAVPLYQAGSFPEAPLE